MRLDELFNKPLPITWKKQQADYWLATFRASKRQYVVAFMRHDTGGEWECHFKMGRIPFVVKSQTTELTGAGSEFQVFSAVIQCIKQFLTAVRPVTLSFTGDDQRTTLYPALLRSFVPQLRTMGYSASHGADPSGIAHSRFSISKVA